MTLTIFWNTRVNPRAEEILRKGTDKHRLIISDSASSSVLARGVSDSGMEHADIAFGQPDPEDCLQSSRLKWIEVSSAGYTRYDTADFFGCLRERSVAFTNVSSVFADPSAQHVLAMMLACGRQLLPSFRDQITDADHIVNILPANQSTAGYCGAQFFSKCRPGARFYNVGRGSTVDQDAVAGALRSGILDAAYLDVTEVEPLPAENELWRVPNCFITPHTAGGRHDQDEALVCHFLRNLAAFEFQQPLVDRVV